MTVVLERICIGGKDMRSEWWWWNDLRTLFDRLEWGRSLCIFHGDWQEKWETFGSDSLVHSARRVDPNGGRKEARYKGECERGRSTMAFPDNEELWGCKRGDAPQWPLSHPSMDDEGWRRCGVFAFRLLSCPFSLCRGLCLCPCLCSCLSLYFGLPSGTTSCPFQSIPRRLSSLDWVVQTQLGDSIR